MHQCAHDLLAAHLAASADAMAAFVADEAARGAILAMADTVEECLRAGGKLLIAGNGGSAADAQHIAAEFTGRLHADRPPLAALALTTDSSALTAIGNDYGFEQVFERQVRALGRPGDVVLGISTSGRSPNVVRALRAAREGGLATLGFTGQGGGGSGGGNGAPDTMGAWCDRLVVAPSARSTVIQQIHITAAHALCALVEQALYPPRAPA